MSDKLQGGIEADSTDVSLPVELRTASDSTATTGKVFSDITGSYWRQGGTRTAITMATLGSVNAAHSDGGFVEVDATNMPGVYRFDVPDAAFASGADWVVISLKCTGSFTESFMFNLTSNVIQTGDAFGRLGAPAGASVSADIATVDGNVDSILTDTGTTLPATLATIDGNVDAILVDTGTTLPATLGTPSVSISADIANLENVSTTEVQSACDTAITLNTKVLEIDAQTELNETGITGLNTILTNVTYGNAALQTELSGVGSDVTTINGKVDTLDTNVDTLLTRITSTLFSGITSLAQWLGLLAGKQTGNSTARTEIRATGAGSGTFDETTDSQEALRDNQTAGGGLDAAGVRAAVGLASANLDTQLGTIDTNVDSILVDTGTTLPTSIATIDTNVDAVLVDTGTTLPAQIAGLSTGAGTGAYTITVTVTDGTDPLETATVRLTEGVSTFVATTDAAGNAQFSLDAATYDVAVTKPGYSFTPTTRTVTASETGTLTSDLEMTLTAVPTPSADPDLCTVYVDTESMLGVAVTDLEIRINLRTAAPAVSTAGRIVSRDFVLMTHDSSSPGRYTATLESGLLYRATCLQLWDPYLDFAIVAETTLDLAD